MHMFGWDSLGDTSYSVMAGASVCISDVMMLLGGGKFYIVATVGSCC